LSAVIVLSVFGVIMVYSASKYNAEYYYNDPFFYAAKQFLGLFLGIISMFFLSNVHYEGYRKIANWLYLISVLLLLLVFVPIIGIERLGAKRWVGFGGFSIQPSEIA
jgi:cell division protein FtsW